MAIAAGAHSTYDEPIATGGNREDLSNVLADVSPTETPFLTLCGSATSTATNHEWLIDALADAVGDNAALEGGDMEGVDPAPRGRLGNYTQNLTKNAVVTGTQEKVLKGGGIKSEMAYQIARRLKEIKRDCEMSGVGVSQPKAAGSESVVRRMGSLDAYLFTNNQLAAGSSDATGDGTDVSDGAGTPRDLDETIFNAALSSLFTNSGGAMELKCITTAASKTVISTFTGNSTRYNTNDDKKLVASVDVYVGDFHTVQIIPDRYCQTGNTFILDPEYVKMADLRGAHSFDIAKLGDSTRKQIIWETTLEVCNEKAHALIGDLNT